MRCSYILYRSSTTGNICNPWHFAKMPRYHTVKCGLGRVKPVLVSLSSQQYANPLILEVRASPHLRVPRVSDQKSLANENGLFGRDSKLVLSARLHHKDYFISRQQHAPMPKFYSLPEQTEQLPCLLAIHLNWPWLYYDKSTPQLIFKGGPYYLIGWTKMK